MSVGQISQRRNPSRAGSSLLRSSSETVRDSSVRAGLAYSLRMTIGGKRNAGWRFCGRHPALSATASIQPYGGSAPKFAFTSATSLEVNDPLTFTSQRKFVMLTP